MFDEPPYKSIWAAQEDDDVFDTLVKKISHHMGPPESGGARRFRFNVHGYDTKKTLNENLLEIQRKAIKAGFTGTELSQRILDKLVVNYPDQSIKERAIENNWSLDTFMEKANKKQMAKETTSMFKSVQNDKEERKVFQVQETKEDQGNSEVRRVMAGCDGCGRSEKCQRDRCPAKGAICFACGKKDHFMGVCNSRPKVMPNRTNWSTQASYPSFQTKDHAKDYKKGYSKYKKMAKTLAGKNSFQRNDKEKKNGKFVKNQKKVRKTEESGGTEMKDQSSDDSSDDLDVDFSSSSDSETNED